ncbi:hypothetical protein [Rodentibacter ratti]|uniref:Uncharacterized protein n=1 Tax=Rodentibacter ratti TaxID=1906745 RepID=A0A1V3L6C9_9PAST|nr:hypothetical protein [Rodentibacter ratti]OOF85160.1 hypothetical protein BKG88_08625 [Rodentibacter ratti]
MKTQINHEIINDLLKNNDIQGYTNNWQDRRIYINLSSKNKSFAGDRNYQLYFDLAANELVSKNVKGTVSSAYFADIKKVEELF